MLFILCGKNQQHHIITRKSPGFWGLNPGFMVKMMNNLMQSSLETCLLHLHIFSVWFFLKEFVAEEGSETNSKYCSGFSYIISCKCPLNQVVGNPRNSTIR